MNFNIGLTKKKVKSSTKNNKKKTRIYIFLILCYKSMNMRMNKCIANLIQEMCVFLNNAK